MRIAASIARALAGSILSLCAVASASAQDVITPTGSFIRPASAALGRQSTKPSFDAFGGSGAAFATGKKQQTNVETKVVRGRFFGPLECKPLPNDRTKEECTATTLFSLELNSYIVDAAGQELIALKEYIMSAKGSPLALRLPDLPLFRRLNRSTYKPGHDDLPQSWVAGQFAFDGRLIPSRLSSGDGQINLTAQASYAVELHGALELGDMPGTVFLTLSPSINYMIGDSLVAALLPVGARKSNFLGAIAYAGGYQLGGPDGTAVRFSGSVSFKELRDGRGQVTVGLRKALSALTPQPK